MQKVLRRMVWLSVLLVAVPVVALPPDVEIARFKYDRAAAYTLTFDDGLVTHITEAIPILERHGLKGTFFVFTDNIKSEPPADWPAWRAAAESGHEVASHSRTHLDLTKTEDRRVLEDEIVGSARIIEQMTGVRPLSFAYPYSAKNDFVKRLVLETYLFDRADCRVWGGDDFTVRMGIANIERAIARREWEYVMLHGVGEYTWGALEPELLDELVAYLAENADRIWTATYSEVATYIRKRNAVQVIRRDIQDDSFSFRLRLPDHVSFRDLPPVALTIRIALDGRDGRRARAEMGDEPLSLRVSPNGKYLLAEIPADGPWVRVSW